MTKALKPVAIAKNRIHANTQPAYIHLNVSDIKKQISFYEQVLRLKLNWRKDNSAGLGIGKKDIVQLTQVKSTKRYQRVTGMYHFAILYPNRQELAQATHALIHLGWPNSPTDHVMTKSIYLDDPEGNSIELYCESPEDGAFYIKDGEIYAQHTDGTVSNGREFLDVEKELFSHLKSSDKSSKFIDLKTRMGHFHLYVADLEATKHFYHDLLGFDDMGIALDFQMGMVSAGGYHHHIGYNTWKGENIPSVPQDREVAFFARLVHFIDKELGKLSQLLENSRFIISNDTKGLMLNDPSGNTILLTTIN